MSSITIELHLICRGCLSFDRTLVPLKHNANLFFLLIADQFIPTDSCYFDLFLCWECIALLRNVAKFQTQLRQSKDIFLTKWLQNKASSNDCLTRLSTYHKDDYDLIIEYHDLYEPKIEISEINTDTNNLAKEESGGNDFDNDNDAETKIDYTKRAKQIKRKSAVPTPVDYDETEKYTYIHEIEMTVQELEALKRNKRDNIRSFSHRANILAKKMLSAKQRDVCNFKKRVSKCSHCATKIPHKKTMTRHWDAHKVTLYKCDFCEHRGHNRDEVMTHLRHKHSNIYTCECGHGFRSLRDYNTHNRNLHTIYICDYCDKRLKSKKSIERHIILHHIPYYCTICQRSFKTYSSLTNHYFAFHPERQPRKKNEESYCVECDIHFQNEFLYKRHLRTSIAHRPRLELKIPCPDCGKIFTRKTYMKNHYKLVHERRSKHYCEICDKYFVTGYAMRTHKKFVHEKAEKPRDKICRLCGLGFFTNRVLLNHIHTHTGERPHRCRYCSAAFVQRSAMRTHEKTQHEKINN